MIRVAAECSTGIVRVSVGDDGIGIGCHVHKGAERLNGKVGVESVLGSGSEFCIELAEA
jgi:signal transduction histidine kinase